MIQPKAITRLSMRCLGLHETLCLNPPTDIESQSMLAKRAKHLWEDTTGAIEAAKAALDTCVVRVLLELKALMRDVFSDAHFGFSAVVFLWDRPGFFFGSGHTLGSRSLLKTRGTLWTIGLWDQIAASKECAAFKAKLLRVESELRACIPFKNRHTAPEPKGKTPPMMISKAERDAFLAAGYKPYKRGDQARMLRENFPSLKGSKGAALRNKLKSEPFGVKWFQPDQEYLVPPRR